MSFDNTPNKLESAFIQRDTSNQYYEQINISGSNLIVYHGADGKLTADKISVWATLYGFGSGSGGGSSNLALSASHASGSDWATVATQSWWATQSLYATQSIYATRSLFSTQSLFTTQSLFATQSLTASFVTASKVFGTVGSASWALTASYVSGSGSGISASYSATASVVLGTVDNSNFSISCSWASSSISSSVAISASYAPSTPSVSSSYALTASYAMNGGSTGGSNSRAVILCAAFNPYFTGADAAEIPVPYDSDGITPLSWSVNRLNLRVQRSGSTTSSVNIEKSSATGEFVSDATIGTLILNSSSYQTFTGSSTNVMSGDKLRFNISNIGTAEYWTITTEITSI